MGECKVGGSGFRGLPYGEDCAEQEMLKLTEQRATSSKMRAEGIGAIG